MKITISTTQMILLFFYCSKLSVIEEDAFQSINELLVNTREYKNKEIHIFTDFSEDNFNKAKKVLRNYGIEEGIIEDSWWDEGGKHTIKSKCLKRTEDFKEKVVYGYLTQLISIEDKFLIIKVVEDLFKKFD